MFYAICGIPSALTTGWAVWAAVKHRNYAWGLFLIGGVAGMFVEPIIDYMGGVWWPLNGWEAFTLLGVNIPWLVPLVYPWLLGGGAYIC